MINYRCGAPKGYQLEVCQCTEYLGLGNGALHYGCLACGLINNQVGLVNHTIKTRVQALNHAVVGTVGVLVQFFHFGVITA